MTIFLKYLTLFSLMLMPYAGAAADIRVVHPRGLPIADILNGRCTIELQGSMAPDDTKALEALISTGAIDPLVNTGNINADLFESGERSHSLCLNSPGGDSAAAIELLRSGTLRDYSIITVVPSEAECLSACALVFLGGTLATSNSSGGHSMPLRVLSVNGRLGFDASFMGTPASETANTSAAQVVALLESLTGNFLDTHQAHLRLPTDLLIEVLKTQETGESFEVTTVNDAGRFGIHLSDAPAVNPTDYAYARLCSNTSLWDASRLSSDMTDIPSWGYTVAASTDSITVTSRHFECSFSHVGEEFGDVFSLAFRDRSGQTNKRLVSAWHSLPHYLSLNALAAASTRQEDFEPIYRHIDPFGNATVPDSVDFAPETVTSIRTDGGEAGLGVIRIELLPSGRAAITGDQIGHLSGEYLIAKSNELCLALDGLTNQGKGQICGIVTNSRLVFGKLPEFSGTIEFQRRLELKW